MDIGGYGNDIFYYANLAEFVDQIHIGFPPSSNCGVVVHIGEFGRRGIFHGMTLCFYNHLTTRVIF